MSRRGVGRRARLIEMLRMWPETMESDKIDV
jgi:hypothetical protein